MAIKKTPAPSVFQFLIELRDIKPKIWRRIQVANLTLNELHECIQTAMGWSNSHLHEYEIEGERYGDTELLNEGRDGDDIDDEHDTRSISLDSLLIRAEKGYQFEYIYDFGDYWQHLVTFEGLVAAKPKTKYPVCVDGARACPPEDVGSTPGYQEFLEALADPRHEQHEHMKEWSGGSFDPEQFSAKEATLSMQKGVSDWRDYHV
jgi:Plasmid pRiA4b ORF-3-like protein